MDGWRRRPCKKRGAGDQILASLAPRIGFQAAAAAETCQSRYPGCLLRFDVVVVVVVSSPPRTFICAFKRRGRKRGDQIIPFLNEQQRLASHSNLILLRSWGSRKSDMASQPASQLLVQIQPNRQAGRRHPRPARF